MQLPNVFVEDIQLILSKARQKTYAIANRQMLQAYWLVGKKIIEEEQRGRKRASYGSFLIRELSLRLVKIFGKGFDERELRRMRQFYQYFPRADMLRTELTWTHYRYILRVDDERARAFYVVETITEGWNTRLLERNINSQYYQRIIANRNKITSKPFIKNKTTPVPSDLIKDPYFLEFLGMSMDSSYSETELEKAILSKLQQFLLELGKGFAFVGRQYHIRTDTKDFYVDLVFYNYLLKCFVLVDLKINSLTHQDIGQMDMYVRLFEDLKKVPGDNPTIGIILCSDKDDTIVKYSVLHESRHLFASKYRLYLPDEKELIREINLEKERLK